MRRPITPGCTEYSLESNRTLWSRQPRPVAPPHFRSHRRHCHHRMMVRPDPISRGAPQPPDASARWRSAATYAADIEIAWATGGSTRQKRTLQIVMGPFDDALMLRLTWFEHDDFGSQHTAEPLAVPGQLRTAGPPSPHRALAVPDQGARHCTQSADDLLPAREQILSPPRRDQDR